MRNERKSHYYDSRFGFRCARPFDPESDGQVSSHDKPEMVMEPPIDADPGDTWIRPFDGAVMVFVPGGTFQMGIGTDQAAAAGWNEHPEHPVYVDSFWIDKYHVTNKQFAEFLFMRGNQLENGVAWYDDESEFGLLEKRLDLYKPYLGFEDHPVIGASWYGAQNYCDWIGGRLLTEAEWEYAASGPENRLYPWGNEFDCRVGNFHDWTDEDVPVSFPGERGCDGFDFTSPVDAYPGGASWVGVLDMAGNVWDWVADWSVYPYPSGYQINPTGPESGTNKIVRGGSWDNYHWGVRTTIRGDYYPSVRSPYIGFRCAYPVDP
jgi:formylglycine-generating enzyme required for sulfatase activity